MDDQVYALGLIDKIFCVFGITGQHHRAAIIIDAVAEGGVDLLAMIDLECGHL